MPVEKVKHRVEQLHEYNPMLGLRGCRLAIRYPEIGDMQVRAIIDAAIAVKKKGMEVLPEIMIPLVGTVEELAFLKKRAIAVADGSHEEGRRQGRLPDRHHDRGPPRRPDGRPDRRARPSSSRSAPTT